MTELNQEALDALIEKLVDRAFKTDGFDNYHFDRSAAREVLAPAFAERTRERDEALELAYELKYAAAGGEDVPLSAHAVTVADVNRWRIEAEQRADAAEARVKALEAEIARLQNG